MPKLKKLYQASVGGHETWITVSFIEKATLQRKGVLVFGLKHMVATAVRTHRGRGRALERRK